MKKLITVAALVLTLAVAVIAPVSADDSAATKLFDNPFRQGLDTQAFWATGNTASALDGEISVRVFDDPFAHSDLEAVLVKKGRDIFSGPYTKQVDKLYTIVGNQVRVARPGAEPMVGPQAVVYTIEHDGRYLRVYDGNYTRFDNIVYTIVDGNVYAGPYPRLDTLVFTSQGDLEEIMFLLPILADGAF
jgi:hypothetical protein